MLQKEHLQYTAMTNFFPLKKKKENEKERSRNAQIDYKLSWLVRQHHRDFNLNSRGSWAPQKPVNRLGVKTRFCLHRPRGISGFYSVPLRMPCLSSPKSQGPLFPVKTVECKDDETFHNLLNTMKLRKHPTPRRRRAWP